MITDLEDYIEAHITPLPPYLGEIDRLTNVRYVNGRMCSGAIQGSLLRMFVAMIAPQRILEIGTFTGYSALCMAEALKGNATIDTIEIDDELEDQILDNLKMSEAGKRVKLHIGNALRVMEKFSPEEFDLVFIDADKRLYADYFLKALPLLRPGGYMIADNTLWDGHVVETSPHSSQTKGVMAFNDMIATRKDLEVTVIPVRDGLTIIRKRE